VIHLLVEVHVLVERGTKIMGIPNRLDIEVAMGKVKTLNREDKTVVCSWGYMNEYMDRAEARIQCYQNDCYFCYSEYGEHWTQDKLECHCPIDIKPGEKVRVKKLYTIERIRKYKKKTAT